jgi:hypothetical protein
MWLFWKNWDKSAEKELLLENGGEQILNSFLSGKY